MNHALQSLARRARCYGVFAGLSITSMVASTGCARFNAGLFAPLPTYRVDTFASEVTWQRKDGEAVPSDKASVARVEIAEVLDAMVQDRGDRMQAQPARFRARIVEVDSGRYDMTLGFQVGERYFASQVGAPSIKEGVHLAMYKGVHPKSRVIPEFYHDPDADSRGRRAKIGVGITGAVLGLGLSVLGVGIAASAPTDVCDYGPGPDYQQFDCYTSIDTTALAIGIPVALTGLLAVGGSIALIVHTAKQPAPKPKKSDEARAFVNIGPTSAGFRLDF